MEILLTGGTGKIGRKLIPVLINEGHHITVLCRNKKRAEEYLPATCRIIIGDVTDKESIHGCCDGIEMVYHFVGISGSEMPSEYEFARYRSINVEGTRNIILEAESSNVKRFIYISSIASMGLVKKLPISSESKCNPLRPYQVSKYEAEQLVLKETKEGKLFGIIIRPAQVYGPDGEYAYTNIIKMIKFGLFPKIGKKDAFVSHCYIDDLIKCLVCLVNKGRAGAIYICTTEKSIGFYESVRLIAKQINKKVLFVTIPKWLMYSCAFIVEKVFNFLGKKPPVTRSNIIAITTDRVYDLSQNKRDLGFTSSVTMEEGIRRCIEYNRLIGIL